MEKLLLCLALCLAILTACAPTDSTTGTTGSTQTTAPSSTGEQIKTITIAEALELCGAEGNVTSERYVIRATVDSVTQAEYGAMIVKDETGSISVYSSYNEDGSVSYKDMKEKPYKGDTVLISCILQNFKGSKEVKNAWILSFEKGQVDVDQSAYTEMTVADAREAATGTKIKVDGIVAQITYANGNIPSGIFLVDETNSILIHDGDLAQRVQIGNEITVLAEKTYWILGSEADNAAKHGYTGSCQLENVVLLENDERTDKSFDHTWVPASTVKDILETPVSENITTTLFKVNALVKKVEGKGFVNYYFYDLDGVTGAYAYTQCSGSDFAWLDEFDGKICTVYLSAINAKSTATECFFRLQPVKVIYEGYTFDKTTTAEHVVKYYGMPQFLSVYSGDPMLEVTTTVSSDLLGFADAKLTYTSSNPSIVNFKEAGGKLYLRGITPGTATITVTGSYDGKTYSETMDITIGDAVTVDYTTIRDAIDSAAGTTVTLKGIVGPSVVNQPGFYLIDDTGVIAIYMDEATTKTLQIGHEIIVEGVREFRNKKDNPDCIGQSYINEPKLITNNYGSHKYSTATFITDKTLAEFYALDPLVDYSTSVFVLKATVKLVETNFFTSIELVSGSTTVKLYCANAGQYAFLQQFAGQEVTLELAACNWNSKSYYTGCVLSVITDSGKVYNELNFG